MTVRWDDSESTFCRDVVTLCSVLKRRHGQAGTVVAVMSNIAMQAYGTLNFLSREYKQKL